VALKIHKYKIARKAGMGSLLGALAISDAASDYCILVVIHTQLLAGNVIGQLKWLLLFPLDRPLSDWGCSPENGSTGRPQAVMIAGDAA
jgi:hypothetical protein